MKFNKTLLVVLKKVLPAVVGLVALVAVIAWLAGVLATKIQPGHTPAARRAVPKYAETYVVHEVYKAPHEWVVGSLQAADRSKVASQYPGAIRIEKIHVNSRQLVKMGDLLIDLDDREAQAQLAQAEAGRQKAAEAVSLAQDVYQRMGATRALDPGAIPDASYTAAGLDVRSAQAGLSQAVSMVTQAAVRLADTKIRAPIHGVIVDRLREAGDTVAPGETLLTMYDTGSLRLEVAVREDLAGGLAQGQPMTVLIDALSEEFTGTVDEKVPQADLASRTILVKIALPLLQQPAELQRLMDAGLSENLSGRLKVPAETRAHLCLAEAAIHSVGQNDFVYVVHEDKDTGEKTLRRRLIKRGQRGMPGRVEVLSGLRDGETVVLRSSAPCPSCPSSSQAGPPTL